MPFVILLDSPILKRCAQFAEKLADQLGQTKLIDISSFPQDTLSDTVTAETDAHFILLYAENALKVEKWRTKVDLKIYLEASKVDITVAVFGSLQERKGAGKSLSDEVQEILREKTGEGKPSGELSRNFADITIEADEILDEAAVSVSGYVTRIDPKTSRAFLDASKRRARLDQMIRQYQHATMTSRKAKIKRQLWLFVVKATLVFKRLMDIVLALTALVLLSPLFLVVALLIKVTDRGPVFYVQKRVGLHGEEFPFPKFRSMVLNADALKDTLLQQADRAGDVTFKMKKDPRVTPIGRFIRRFSIDELPQLWCVLIGDMSIVGPRPPVPREVALYTQEDRRRLEVKPGLTGIWQVSGRSEIGFKQQVELDVLYIESHGFWLDLKLILKTIPAVLTGKGAY
nr:exopolysaccharide biosynthesis polyprenyl glycosylphosphotransferase [uncultured Sphaerochaeta sp.]